MPRHIKSFKDSLVIIIVKYIINSHIGGQYDEVYECVGIFPSQIFSHPYNSHLSLLPSGQEEIVQWDPEEAIVVCYNCLL